MYAPWLSQDITGIGTEGYYTTFGTTANTGLGAYGWVSGYIPNLHPMAINGEPPVVIGMEVLCRDSKLTCGAFYEGKIVDASLNGKWVCKLNRLDIQILPFVQSIDIRPLCFAKESDYEMAEKHWDVHPHPNWREERRLQDLNDAADVPCTAFCAIKINQNGNCPDFACLKQPILSRDKSTNSYFIDGEISGIFLTDPLPNPPGPSTGWPWAYAINQEAYEGKAQWGPMPGAAQQYIVPKSVAPATTSYGQMVICEDPGKGVPDCTATTCYALGTIFNVPGGNIPTDDGQFHQYTCDAQGTMDKSGRISCGKDTSNMWEICYPSPL
jgi:hypothetical protein